MDLKNNWIEVGRNSMYFNQFYFFLQRKRILQYPTLETIVHRISNEREEREKNREKK